MPRYTFSEEDRRKGGKTTAQRYDMRARGRLGLLAIADKYCDGNLKLAKECLWRTGLLFTDPVPSKLPLFWLVRIGFIPHLFA